MEERPKSAPAVSGCSESPTTTLLAPLAIKRWQLVGYASGNFGKNLLWSTADLTLLFLFTDVMKIDPGVAGTIIFASLCINAVLDPLMGALADRLRSPLGRSAPLILLGAPLCGLAFAALYALPTAGPVSLVTAVVLLFTFRAAFASMDAPHNSALATLVSDPARRGALSSLRFVFSSVATLAVLAVIPALLAARSAVETGTLAVIASIAGALSALVMIGAALAVSGLDRPEPSWGFERPMRRTVPAVLRSCTVILVLAITFVLSVGMPLFAKMIIYHATYVVADPPRANIMLGAMIVGQIAGLPGWTLALKRFGPVEALGVAIISVLGATAVMPLTAGQSSVWDAALALCFGLGTGGIYSVIWVVVADCADREARAGEAMSAGFLFGLAIVALKLGQGVGAFASGQLLASAGYAPDVVQNDNVILVIKTISSGGPIIAGVMAIALLLIYRRTASRNFASTPK